MGITQSTLSLTQSEVLEVVAYTDGVLTAGEIESLYRRFRSLDKQHKGFVSSEVRARGGRVGNARARADGRARGGSRQTPPRPQELAKIPEVALNPLSYRLCQLADGANFKHFASLVAAFSPRADTPRKLRFVLQFLDVDGDGVVGRDDLLHVLRQMAGTHLDDRELERVASAILAEAAAGGASPRGVTPDVLGGAGSADALAFAIPRAW